jgi:Right handed beta helix region
VTNRIVPVRPRSLRWLAAAALFAAVALWPGGGAGAEASCDKVASPTGLDTNPGSLLLPYRSVQKLADALAPGQVGCLRGGTYIGSLTVRRGGTADAPILIESRPGERARLVGRVVVAPGADYVTLWQLDLVGTNPLHAPSPTIEANHVTIADSDITNLHTAKCVFVGSSDHFVDHATIFRNRIHDCGLLPRTYHHHGISVWNAGDTKITRNVIDHNADRGVQLYPNAQRTRVSFNTIDANGQDVQIAGNAVLAPSDNVIDRNVITNSAAGDNVGAYWPDGAPVGTGNVVRENCVSGGGRDNGDGGIQARVRGVLVSGNLVAAPGYVDVAAGNYDLQPSSACEPVLSSLPWEPFRDDSPWNVPANQKGYLTPDNPYASQFTSYSGELGISGIPNGGASGTAYAKPIFFAQPDDPQYVWTNLNGWGKGDIHYQDEPIPMPDGAMEASGSDGHLTIVTADRHYAYDMWRADVSTRSAAVIVRFDLTGSGVPGDQYQNTSARGSGAPIIPSTVRADEALRGIRHAIGITVPSVSSDYIYPATHTDGDLGPDAIKYGMLFVLRPNYPVPADAGVGERNIITALKTYGAYVVDQGASMELDADSTHPGQWDLTGLRADTLSIRPEDFRFVVPSQ